MNQNSYGAEHTPDAVSAVTGRPTRDRSQPVSQERRRSVRFLLVEDDEDHAFLVEHFLLQGDPANQVTRVSDGQEALAYLRQQGRYEGAMRPDVVLLDLKLPKVDGHEVLLQIKEDPKLSRIPVVVLTTSGAESDQHRAYRAHANSYLVKPIDSQKFRAMIEMLSRYWRDWNHRCEGER